MDYGPFGFIEIYERHWNMYVACVGGHSVVVAKIALVIYSVLCRWVGGGESYSFMMQPTVRRFRNRLAGTRILTHAFVI